MLALIGDSENGPATQTAVLRRRDIKRAGHRQGPLEGLWTGGRPSVPRWMRHQSPRELL